MLLIGDATNVWYQAIVIQSAGLMYREPLPHDARALSQYKALKYSSYAETPAKAAPLCSTEVSTVVVEDLDGGNGAVRRRPHRRA